MDPQAAKNNFPLWPSGFIFLTLLFSSLVLHTSAAANATAHLPRFIENTNTDHIALLSIKALISDPLGALNSWTNITLHYCNWTGVTCGRRHHRVTGLDLNSLNLTGTISPSLANLTFLRRVNLFNNNLHGHIPQELGQLFRLQHLNLSVNSLTGEIPSTLSHCTHLEKINLNNNLLHGKIPSSLSRCLNIQSLILSNNNLGGEIPREFGSLPKLETLLLGNNNLTGSIPPALGTSLSLSYVDLSSNNLIGGVPSSLGSSPSLIFIDLSDNHLTGGVPPSLGSTPKLMYVYLSKNSLTGGIPLSLGNSSSLSYLDLSSNDLTGGIPPFIGPLQFLGLSTNLLSGGIPPSLGNVATLRHLYLAENSLDGSIPDKLSDIPNLVELDLSINRLSGEVPPRLYNMSSITYFGVGDNKLHGMLPLDIGHTLPNLENLVMQGNQFQGPIPSSISNMSKLQLLNLASNLFSGPVPSNLGALQNLQELNIGWNQLQANDWSFLSSLASCSLLKRLNLESNKLEGTLPTSMGNLSRHLEWLFIGENQISGSIPEEIGNLVSLTALFMGDNHLTENIPPTIGKLHNLHVLNLTRNKLSGPIPMSLGNLQQLNELHMQENELSGSIPVTLGNCKALVLFNLSYNSISGTIPKELVSLSSFTQYLDLSHNSLTGSLPMQVGSLINLGRLDVSNNELSGEIPGTLGACQHLEYLHMEGNSFQGRIPQSFKDLRGLTELDLSRNQLSGEIPEFLETFVSLQYLNLSYNDLEGQVPTGHVFGNTSEVFVSGNKKLCGGNPKLQLPSCSAQDRKGKQNSDALKVIIPTIGGVVIILLLTSISILCRVRKAEKEAAQESSKEGEDRKVSYTDIAKATDGFSPANLLGVGSFGSVYKAKMDVAQNIVAVKVLNLERSGAIKSFTAECKALRNIRHRNLIKVVTLCSSLDPRGNDFKALVFEYMPNGSLEKWLHPDDIEHGQPKKLNLTQWLNIALDVASALAHLHHNCQPPVVHCDLKPSNVLLDDDMVAHVGDFGLARFLSDSTSSSTSASLLGIKGSIGYIAPEYGTGGQISTQGDVYSYGILLLEILTGKKPTDDMFKDGLNLHKFVAIAFPEKVMEIVDSQIIQDEREEASGITGDRSVARERIHLCILSLIRVGLSCSKELPSDRMKMRNVASTIHKIKGMFSASGREA